MAFLFGLFSPEMSVSIFPNRVTVHSPKLGRSASSDAPFSCGELIVADGDVLEHAVRQAFVNLATSGWIFPRISVAVPGREVHTIELKVIREAILNAGASELDLSAVATCGQCRESFESYAKAIKAKR